MSRHDGGGTTLSILNDDAPPSEVQQGLGILAQIQVSLGRLADQMERQNDQLQRQWQGVRPLTNIPLPQITTTNGSCDNPDLMAPRTGYWWDVKVAGAFTFSGGSVNLYLAGGTVDSNIVGAFPSSGYLTYGSQQLLFNWNSRLIFKAVSVTGNVTPNLSVVEVADWALPAYLI